MPYNRHNWIGDYRTGTLAVLDSHDLTGNTTLAMGFQDLSAQSDYRTAPPLSSLPGEVSDVEWRACAAATPALGTENLGAISVQ